MSYNKTRKWETQVTIAEQLMEDVKTSMKAGDSSRTGVLRLVRAAFKNEEIKQGSPLDEAQMLKVLIREAKQRRDSIAAYRMAGREDLAVTEEQELTIIQAYLPSALSEDELVKLVDEVATELGAGGPAQMGAVIGQVMKRAGARAEGGVVSRLVRERLSL